MDEFTVIKIMNDSTLKVLEKNKKDCLINKKIKRNLQDEAFFFKIKKEMAFKILLCVGVKKDQLERVYQKLIDPSVYYKLIRENKLSANNENLIIKYN